ncbi:MAG: hypothetical protein CMC08_00085 [Flavobacteriaceae bacterium]|nr:hypothetical protein [Flavobacteriaceae bacterium]
MKFIAALFSLFFLLISCSNSENQMVLHGKVKGLRKGTVLLQKFEDSLLVSVDSVKIDGEPNFTFEENVESPEIYYLYLRLKNGTLLDERIGFFAAPGEITVITTLKNFNTDAHITGSANQELLEEYRKLMARYNDKNLNYIEDSFLAQQQGNDSVVLALADAQRGILSRKYLATVNFALQNNNAEIAPYLMLSEVFDANIKYLDTVYGNLTPKIKDSKYGGMLESFIAERRAAGN